jgi:hypothetical protein
MVVAVLLVMVAAGAAFANGNAEKLTTVEGTVVSVEKAGALARLMVETQTREMVMVELPAGEIERLRIREQSRIRVEGVLIGVPEQLQQRLQTRLKARTVNTGDGDVPVEDPLRVTLRERQQIRTWEREQDGDGTQLRTQTQDQARDGTGGGSQAQQQTGKP